MRSESLSFLRILLDTTPPDLKVRGKSCGQLPGQWATNVGTCMGTLAAIGDEDACTVACGHADEIGLMVNHIDDGLYCVQIGGIDLATVVGNRVGFQPPLTVWRKRSWALSARPRCMQDKPAMPRSVSCMNSLLTLALGREEALSRVALATWCLYCRQFAVGRAPAGGSCPRQSSWHFAAGDLRLLREQGVLKASAWWRSPPFKKKSVFAVRP